MISTSMTCSLSSVIPGWENADRRTDDGIRLLWRRRKLEDWLDAHSSIWEFCWFVISELEKAK